MKKSNTLKNLIEAINIFYASDSSNLYDFRSGAQVSVEELQSRILIYGGSGADYADVILELVRLGDTYNATISKHRRKQRELKLTQEKPRKLGKKDLFKLRLDKAYDDLKHKLPFVFVKKSEGSTFPFRRLNENEVMTIKAPTSDALISSLQSNLEEYQIFLDYFENSDTLQIELTIGEFLEELIKRAMHDTTLSSKKEPKFITWKKGELAFKYFDIETLIDAPTPYFDDFCSRLDFPEVFMAWCWSIFEPNDKGRQIMWIRGLGHDGKSTVFKALCNFIGQHHSNIISGSEFDSPFFFNEVYGRILVAYPDCKITNIFANEKIQNITGGDEQVINGKYAQTFKASVYSKVLIGSNQFPQVSWHLKYQSSRMIVLQIDALDDKKVGDSNAEPALYAETPAFLKKCKEMYKKYYKENNSELKVSKDLQKKMHSLYISNEVSVLKSFCNTRLEFNEDYVVSDMQLKSEIRMALKEFSIKPGRDFDILCEEYVKTLKPYIQGPVEVKINDNITLGFKGIKLKDPENNFKKV